MGVYFSGQFHLLVSLRFTPLDGEIDFLQELFEQASRILHDATDGAHSIGHVFVAVDSWGTKSADLFVHFGGGHLPNATGARLWFPAESIDFWQDGLTDATVLAHELAHYLYDLRDEYIGLVPSCVGAIGAQACLMEGYSYTDHTRWVRASNHQSISSFALFLPEHLALNTLLVHGQPSDFCHPGNHDAGAATPQNALNSGQSCWSWMVDDERHGKIAYGLALPGSGPALAAPALPPTVVLDELISMQRFALVLDCSASMGGAKLAHLKVGAHFWIDHVNAGEELAILAFASAPSVTASRSVVPPDASMEGWRAERHAAVDGFVAAGSTAIGDALMAGLEQLVAGGLAADQVLLLFTDGNQNAGVLASEQVLPELIAANVRVYAIGLGADPDAALLEWIATATGGGYYPIDASLTPEEAEHAISETLMYLAGESRNGGSVADFSDADGSIPPNAPAPPYRWIEDERSTSVPRIPERRNARSLEFPVVIAAESAQCTLGVYWKSSSAGFDVAIVDPDGNTLAAGSGARQVRGARPYAFDVVERPAGGTWKVRVSGPELGAARLRVFGFQVHAGFRLEARVSRTIVRPGREIAISVRLLVPQPVPGTRIDAWVRAPGKRRARALALDESEARENEVGHRAPPTLKFRTEPDVRGAYLVALNVSRPAGRFEFVPDGLRWIGSERPADARSVVVDVPAIEQRVIKSFVADASGRHEDFPLHGSNARAPFVPDDQARRVDAWKRSRQR